MAEIVEAWQGYRYPSGQPLRPRPHWAKDMPTGLSFIRLYWRKIDGKNISVVRVQDSCLKTYISFGERFRSVEVYKELGMFPREYMWVTALQDTMWPGPVPPHSYQRCLKSVL